MTRGPLARAVVLLLVVGALVASPAAAHDRCDVPPGVSAIRPGPADEPTRVEIASYVMDIESIDDALQEFTVDVVLAAAWQDDRLGEAARRNGAPCAFPVDEVWHPFLQLLNERSVRMRLPGLIRVDETGQARIIRRFYGTFSSPFDLRAFPFDEPRDGAPSHPI